MRAPKNLTPPDGYRVEVFDRIGSTNDEAMSRGRSGDPGRLWIVAREQSAGRGRNERVWSSPIGNLYTSLLLVDPSPPDVAPQLGFVAGLAAADAVSDFLRQDRRLTLKWPNDLLFARAKLAGVLLEGGRAAGGPFVCVIGFGVNCAHHPAGLEYPATDLACICRPVDPMVMFEKLAHKAEQWISVWNGGAGFPRIREAWLSYAAGLGERIKVRMRGGVLEGVFSSVDDRGRLILQTGDGARTIEAGDVFLPLMDEGQPLGMIIR